VHGVIDFKNPEERDAAAGEYVLGTLDAEDRQAVADALPTDRALRADVFAWQDRLLALTARAAPATPSVSLWRRIEIALGASTVETPRSASPRSAPWWQGLRLWQGLTGAALAMSLVLAVLVLSPQPQAERYVTLLQSPADKSTGWVVEANAGGTLKLIPVGAPNEVPAGRAWQFWTKPQGAAGPTSLGLVRAGETIEMPVSRLPAVQAQQLFEITLEPEGGSTIGRPTGPILYVGTSIRI
jgi:anti-sigma-K factor RskA